MTMKMQLDLPDEVYDALARLAQGGGQSPEQMVSEWILSAANTIEGISIRSSRASRSTTRRSTAARSTPAPPQTDQAQNDATDKSSRPEQALARRTGRTGGTGTEAKAVYQLKITLLESKPAIWRRVQVPGNITLIKLHHALQVLMGWQDYHLHQFTVNGELYGMRVEDWQDATPELLDERGVRLYRIAPVTGTRLVYEYDFGDGWQLEIIVEDIKDIKAASFPQESIQERTGSVLAHVVCLDGQRAGPPEDVGGIGGYEEFVKAIRNHRHPEHSSWLEWVGGSFDPEKFDLERANRALEKIR